MDEQTIEFWREAFRAEITRIETTVIKRGFWPTTVSRVRLESPDPSVPRTVICKSARPGWQNDAFGQEREYRVYTELLPHIPIPHAACYFAVPGDAKNSTHLVLRDLGDEFVFFPETHVWTPAQGSAILRVLARLHIAGQALAVAERPYLMPRLSCRWNPAQARAMFSDFLHSPHLRERVLPAAAWVETVLDKLPRLAEIAANEPLTLVHYDVYPPNMGFPRHGEPHEVVLIDWALATADIAEIDLAFMFQQPYNSEQQLDWSSALDYYWQARMQLTGQAIDREQRRAIFQYARIQTLFTTLVPIHRAWEKAVRAGDVIGADSPDPFMRFYDAALTKIILTLRELAEHDG